MNELCTLRARLFSNKSNRHGDSDLTEDQLRMLGQYVRASYTHFSASTSAVSVTAPILVDCMIVVGRWLRPAEVQALFGEGVRLFSKIVRIEEEEEEQRKEANNARRDTRTKTKTRTRTTQMNRQGFVARDLEEHANEKMRRDGRISYIIGKGGDRLNQITRASGCIYIWISNYETVEMYAAATSVHEAEASFVHAVALMNDAWSKYAPRHLTDNPRRLVIRSGSFTLPVTVDMLKRAVLH